MSDKKNKKTLENDSLIEEEANELNLFIKKKKIQNKVLEKIIHKLNTPVENKDNK